MFPVSQTCNPDAATCSINIGTIPMLMPAKVRVNVSELAAALLKFLAEEDVREQH